MQDALLVNIGFHLFSIFIKPSSFAIQFILFIKTFFSHLACIVINQAFSIQLALGIIMFNIHYLLAILMVIFPFSYMVFTTHFPLTNNFSIGSIKDDFSHVEIGRAHV